MSDLLKNQKHVASHLRCLAVLAMMVAISVGCGTSDVAETTIPVGQTGTLEQQYPQTNSVNAASNVEAESPAAGQNKLPDPDASPTVICEKFVRFLNADNQQNVELLLTPAALTVTTRAEFQIPPIGEPNAKFTLSEPRYSTNKQNLCYVDCKLSTLVEDKEIRTEVTWMLRRQKLGWRIAGMLVADESTGLLDLLSFENINDVSRIKNDLSQEVSIKQLDSAIIGQSTSKQP